MTPSENETHRAAALLLGDLLLRGPAAALLDEARALPGLAELLPDAEDKIGGETFAAEHYRLFDQEVFPFASLFLTEEGVCGGACGALAEDHWLAQAVERPHINVSADHFGLLLLLLAQTRDEEQQADIFDQILLPWLAPFLLAVRKAGGGWVAIVELAAELAIAHRASLTRPITLVPLLDAPALLNDDETRLRDLARFLLTPVFAGAFLSTATLADLARAVKAPRGFGGRALMLNNLIHSAVEYGDVGDVFAALQQSFAQIDGDYANLHLPSVVVTRWRERVQATGALLVDIQGRIGLQRQAQGSEPFGSVAP